MKHVHLRAVKDTTYKAPKDELALTLQNGMANKRFATLKAVTGCFHLREVKFTFPVIRRSVPAVHWAALMAILQLVIILPLAN